MSDTVRARAEHLLVDGQRIALLGPLGMEEYYDRRFPRDAYDVGRRTWDMRIDVLGVQEIGDDVPDLAWVPPGSLRWRSSSVSAAGFWSKATWPGAIAYAANAWQH